MQIQLVLLATTALAHMSLLSPPPLKSKHNPHATTIDWSITNPLSASGSDFPCKGYLNLLGTVEGASVATWGAGTTQTLTLEGGAMHAGGTCQASLSHDGGASFRVMHTWIGGCPLAKAYSFRVPGEAASGEAVFAWTWFNRVGNREMYMSCAVVTITGGGGGMGGRPGIFVANVGNGCGTVEGGDVMVPNPGGGCYG